MKTEATTTNGNGSLRAAVCRSALKLQSDERLVGLARSGSDPAFEVIVERYRSPLLSYCSRLVGADRAEDVVQQTFASALTSLREGDPPVQLKPWLYRVAHNFTVDTLKRKGQDYEQLDENYDGVPQPPQVFEQRQDLRRLVDQIGELPERWRSALILRELEGRSIEEIAHELQCTPAGSHKLIQRARTRLRDSLGLLVPLPLLRLSGPPSASAESLRIAELVGSAGASGGLAKAGADLVTAGALAVGASTTIPHSDDRPDRSKADAAPIAGPVADARQPEGRASAGNRDSRGRAPGSSGHHERAGQTPPSAGGAPNNPGPGRDRSDEGGGRETPGAGGGSEDAPATAPGDGGTGGGGGGGVSASPGSVEITGTTLHVEAGSGQVNSIRISTGDSTFTVDDANGQVLDASAAAASSSSACSQVSESRVRCPSAGLKKLDIDAGDQDDIVAVSDSVALRATIDGGPGDDRLSGGARDDDLDGGAGADVLIGGKGKDSVTYASRSASVTVTIDNLANDGVQGGTEGDNVKSDIETVYGSGYADVLTGSPQADSLVGNAGDDVLSGGSGGDWIVGSAGDDTLNGGEGRDWLFGLAGNDTSNGGEGNDILTDEFGSGWGRDTLNGGPGGDILNGGSGSDIYDAGSGRDTLFTQDQTDEQSIDCGADIDALTADSSPLDASTGCE